MLRSKLILLTAALAISGSIARASGPVVADPDEGLGGSNPNIVNPDDPGSAAEERKQTPIESAIMKALQIFKRQSPAVFDAVCGQCSALPAAQQDQTFANWQVQGPLSTLTDSMKMPQTIWDYGTRMDSKLVAMRMDIFFEGFYRNLEFEAGGRKNIPQPWLQFNAATKSYTAMTSGAGPVIYRNLLRQPNYDVKTGILTLYRGTSQSESDRLQQIQKLAGNPATRSQAVAQANQIATAFKNGLFAADLKDTAERYAGNVHGDKPAVLTVKVPAAVLKGMIDRDEVYMGYEMGYFELGFFSGPAILMFAQGLQK